MDTGEGLVVAEGRGDVLMLRMHLVTGMCELVAC